MRRLLVGMSLLSLVAVGVATAQTEAKSRLPEVERMEGYIGNWVYEETIKESSTGPEQTVKGTWQAQWLGSQLVEWRSRWTASGTEYTGVELEGWDPEKKRQYSSWFGSDGAHGTLSGTWDATTLTFDVAGVSAEGKATKARCVFPWGDFTSVEYRCESKEKGKTWVSRQGKAVKVVPSTTTAMGTGPVFGIHHLALKPGVEPAEFERFAAEEWTPAFDELYPGVKTRIVKGERGRAPGTYLLVFEIGSLRVRDYYFPKPTEVSEVTAAIDKACGERCERVQSRFGELATTTEYTDYFALVKE